MLWGREPVLILGLIRAVVVLVTAFGLGLSAEQVASIYLVAEAVLSLVIRQRVTPVSEEPAVGAQEGD
jgi:hypothetical protein